MGKGDVGRSRGGVEQKSRKQICKWIGKEAFRGFRFYFRGRRETRVVNKEEKQQRRRRKKRRNAAFLETSVSSNVLRKLPSSAITGRALEMRLKNTRSQRRGSALTKTATSLLLSGKGRENKDSSYTPQRAKKGKGKLRIKRGRKGGQRSQGHLGVGGEIWGSYFKDKKKGRLVGRSDYGPPTNTKRIREKRIVMHADKSNQSLVTTLGENGQKGTCDDKKRTFLSVGALAAGVRGLFL